MRYKTSRDFAQGLDEADELQKYRSRFLIPEDDSGRELIYFVGHSLGLQPRTTKAAIEEELDAWAARGVDAHFRGTRPWTRYDEVVGAPMAGIVGANPAEIALMNGLTVNLHLMMLSFYRPSESRYKIVIEDHAFPSDRYAVQSQVRLHGGDPADAIIVLTPREGQHTLRTEDIVETILENGPQVALVMLGAVNYYTGQYFDLKAVTEAAHDCGALVGFDLAHAAGNVELHLHDWDVDFAVWCTYKYLNAGPGSLAGCFVHESRYSHPDVFRLSGWWGEDPGKRFRMQGDFEPAAGAAGWQISNPNILSLGAIRASLSIFQEAGLERLRLKQKRLTGYLEYLLQERTRNRVQVITPGNPDCRGSQLSLLIRDGGREVYEGLRRSGFVCDWRNPNVIRVAPVPLYNRFEEVWQFVDALDR